MWFFSEKYTKSLSLFLSWPWKKDAVTLSGLLCYYCYSAGCFCPNGTVKHNEECIYTDDCPKPSKLLPIEVETVAILESTLPGLANGTKLYTVYHYELPKKIHL